ncbi:nitrogen fixation protein NifX [Cyanobacterium sp. uoEpiScrs1]|uniref:nitrogen fixation protein NifX n=1 Tax=Cyanobacterium sp. uoEpiScrs1 TaxID=2976343 RepID=UPI002269D332|nr:nitrogen fixation protein NifX [Cyanobacterium sp. uoEpiScrs1]
MKVAFTTSNRIHINAHFGWAKEIDIYDVTTEGFSFDKTLQFSGDLKEDGNEDKINPKLEALKGCTIIYVAAIGGSAAARLIRSNVTPVKARSESETIEELLTELVKTLKGNPPPWLRKVLKQESEPLDFEDEDEEEISAI